ncbi:hypothetical protein BpHYR1_053920 [Brachionus plicatilis]|uniref:Uncharacterized protein n=1 Tax=Brachionus plicatilis TaxID=10195 RepID=A0A3M7QBN9_BRAPC|nr:hypothetical protein BpHYR1_053920 [Brachionus plicatilis]
MSSSFNYTKAILKVSLYQKFVKSKIFCIYSLNIDSFNRELTLKRSINTCSNTSNEGDRIDGPKGTNKEEEMKKERE